jgi:hypothetical protein
MEGDLMHKSCLGLGSRLAGARLAPVLLLPLLLTGCFSLPSSNKLTFRSNQNGETYSQAFKQAYYSRTADGQYDVVLLANGITPRPTKSSGPIASAPGGPLDQTVQVRVLWKPLRGAKPDAPSATNSVIDWYVQTTDSGADRLHYRGAGLVSVSEGKNTAKFNIRNAQVALREGAGRLHDPLGASSLNGSFQAIRNDDIVASTIAQLHRENGKPHGSQASVHEGPPARIPEP